MNKKPNTFPIPSNWLTNTVRVHVIGCGGTGAQVLTRLGQMDHALREMGHAGFDVTIWDDDKVEPFNVGRQPFYMADVGHHKAKVLVNRVNIAYGCAWTAQTCRFKAKDAPRGHALIIGCVDTKASRREIHKGLTEQYSRNVWLDFGNSRSTGQVVIGSICQNDLVGTIEQGDRLPVVTELFPEMLDASIPEPDDVPSCSMRQALEKQSLFINSEMATQGMALLWELFTVGHLRRQGVFINLDEGRVNPMPISSEFWRRMGLQVSETPEKVSA